MAKEKKPKSNWVGGSFKAAVGLFAKKKMKKAVKSVKKSVKRSSKKILGF